MLRTNGIQLKHRVGGTLEVESGINDPVAVILTTLLTRQLLGEHISIWMATLDVLREIVIGGDVRRRDRHGARWLLKRTRLPASGSTR